MRHLEATRLSLAVIVFLKCITYIGGVTQCYKCLVAPPSFYTNETVRLCKDFDYSDKFIVDCPFSTFCMKRFTSAKIPDPINGTERNCASQKFETQKYYNQKWHSEVIIEDPYKEGCTKVDDKGARTTTTEICYCKGDLCNSTNRPRLSLLLILSTVITITLSLIRHELHSDL